MSTPTPPGDVSVTAPGCPACGQPLPAGRSRRFCSAACRQAAYRRRHQRVAPVAVLPPRRSRLQGTLYQCPECDTRYLAEQWCPDCSRPCQRLVWVGMSVNVITLVSVTLVETCGSWRIRTTDASRRSRGGRSSLTAAAVLALATVAGWGWLHPKGLSGLAVFAIVILSALSVFCLVEEHDDGTDPAEHVMTESAVVSS
jgi:hypothetical protein